MTDAKVTFQGLDYHDLTSEEIAAGSRPCRFSFECPIRRDRCGGLLIVGADLGDGQTAKRGPNAKPAMWDWDGNVGRPTFSPSINCRTHTDDGRQTAGCGWHGYIKDGQITS